MNNASLPLKFLFVFLSLSFYTAVSLSHSAEVAIKGTKFVPQTIEIKAGETVKWTNVSKGLHTATSGKNCEPDNGWDSKMIRQQKRKPKQSVYSHKFDKPGTYPYFCKPHCEGYEMTGVVIVK